MLYTLATHALAEAPPCTIAIYFTIVAAFNAGAGFALEFVCPWQVREPESADFCHPSALFYQKPDRTSPSGEPADLD